MSSDYFFLQVFLWLSRYSQLNRYSFVTRVRSWSWIKICQWKLTLRRLMHILSLIFMSFSRLVDNCSSHEDISSSLDWKFRFVRQFSNERLWIISSWFSMRRKVIFILKRRIEILDSMLLCLISRAVFIHYSSAFWLSLLYLFLCLLKSIKFNNASLSYDQWSSILRFVYDCLTVQWRNSYWYLFKIFSKLTIISRDRSTYLELLLIVCIYDNFVHISQRNFSPLIHKMIVQRRRMFYEFLNFLSLMNRVILVLLRILVRQHLILKVYFYRI